jgi:hypothetical protein
VSHRLRSLSDDELGSALASVVPEAAWPATPDLVGDVVAEIVAVERRPAVRVVLPRIPSRRRRLILLVAALVALTAVAAATRFVIDLGAISIQTIEGRPTALPSATAPPSLGRPVTLERAATIAGFDPVVPVALGPPDRVWVDRGPVSFEEVASRVVMAWRPGPGLPRIDGSDWGAVLMAFEGTADVAFKFLYEDTGSIEEAFVDGRPAYWTVGRHRLDLLTDDGLKTVRVRGNVLLWNDAGLALRLETVLTKDEAIRIAESV